MSRRELSAVILAAGEGRRLAPLTNRRPKPMVPVVNKPLLEHVLEAVVAAGIEHVVLVVGYQRDRIQTHFGDGDDWGVHIEYATQERQLGTGHALAQAESSVNGPFLVLNGDRIIDPSAVEAVRDALLESDTSTVIAVSRSSRPREYGVVTLDGARVSNIVEKPVGETPSTIINAGIYGFDTDIFETLDQIEIGPDGEYQLTAALANQIDDGGVRAVRYDGRWLDVSQLWDLLSVTAKVLDTSGGTTSGGYDTGAVVSETSHVDETASIGANTVIGRGTTVDENVHVGANTTIERSVIFPDATVESGAVLRDCIVGANATVGANVTVASGETTVLVDGTAHDGVTLGGVVGDNATIGGGVSFEPGTILGDSADVATGVTLQGTVENGAVVRRG